MSIYPTPSRSDAPAAVRAWWIHLVVALTLTVSAVTVIVVDAIATSFKVPHIVEEVLVVAAVGAWIACRCARISVDAQVALTAVGGELVALRATMQEELAATQVLIDNRLHRAGYAEGRLDGYLESTGESTQRIDTLRLVR